MKRSLVLSALGVLLAAALAPSASAVVLPIDTSVNLPLEADPLGTLLATQTVDVDAPGAFSGVLTTRVFESASGLSFLYQFANDATSGGSIARITMTGFGAPMVTDVSYRTDFGGVQAPTAADRSAGDGDVLGFTFFSQPVGLGKVDPGETSYAILVRTNAVGYDDNHAANLIDGGAASVRVLGPSPVPEPASLAAFALGGLGVLARRRRREA